MIPTDYCDTEEPRNLNFSDFSPDSASLPPSRPFTDDTSILYFIIKGKIMSVFRKIVAHTQSLSSPRLETTIMLDIEAHETYNSIPHNFKMVDVNRSFMDTPATIMKRCTIELLYLKGVVVLHRKFLTRDAANSKYDKLRRTCLDAAMAILARQNDLFQACQPGGRLSDDQWMVSSISVHDFLLAAMVVCLELSMHTTTKAREAEFPKQIDALRTSQSIWTSLSSQSKEARTAAQVLQVMIRTVEGGSINKFPSSALPSKDLPYSQDFTFPYAEPVTEMIEGSENLDWVSSIRYQSS
jgi:hypothetical protein